MRIAVFAAIALLSVQSAYAGTAAWVLQAYDLTYQDSPAKYTFLLPSGQEWNIPVAGSTHILDATSADSFGFDWDTWQTFFTAGGSFSFLADVQYPSLGTNYPPEIMKRLDGSTRVNVSSGSESVWLRAYFEPINGRVFAQMIAFADNVPEPASATLFLWGSCWLNRRSSRRNSRAT